MQSPERLIPGSALTGSTATYFTAQTKSILKSLRFCNTSATPVTVSVWIVPPAGSPGTANKIMHDETLATGYSPPFYMAEVLPTGYMVQASCSVNGVTGFTASGIVYT